MLGKSNGVFIFWDNFICLNILKLKKAYVDSVLLFGPMYNICLHGNRQLKHINIKINSSINWLWHIFKNIAEIPVWVWGGVGNWCRHYGN